MRARNLPDALTAGKRPAPSHRTRPNGWRLEPDKVPLESDIQHAAKEALARHPAVAKVFRMNSGAKIVDGHFDKGGVWHKRRFVRYHTVEGLSDLWLWLKPRYGPRQAFVEIKRPGEKPTPEQAAFLELAREHGHIAFWADDAAKAWEMLSEALR